jgi:hypothetical protein
VVRVCCVLVQDKRLYQSTDESAPRVDERAKENQSWPAIAWRIIEICKKARDLAATHNAGGKHRREEKY